MWIKVFLFWLLIISRMHRNIQCWMNFFTFVFEIHLPLFKFETKTEILLVCYQFAVHPRNYGCKWLWVMNDLCVVAHPTQNVYVSFVLQLFSLAGRESIISYAMVSSHQCSILILTELRIQARKKTYRKKPQAFLFPSIYGKECTDASLYTSHWPSPSRRVSLKRRGGKEGPDKRQGHCLCVPFVKFTSLLLDKTTLQRH